MHDETFYVTKGTIRFHIPEKIGMGAYLDAKAGDYVVVPTRAPHTFSNPFDEEGVFINTYTPVSIAEKLPSWAAVGVRVDSLTTS